jgi:diguanylate cyclase (GGDEF)-like protein
MYPLSPKSLSTFIIPGLLVCAAFWVLHHATALPPARLELLPHLPSLVLTIGALLAFYYHRGRVLCIVIILAAAYWSLCTVPPGNPRGISATALFQAICVLVPGNIALFSLMRERGIFTIAGRLRLTFLAVQAVVVAWVVEPGHVAVQQLLSRQLFGGHLLQGLVMPQLALPVIALSTLVLIVRGCFRQAPIEGSLLGVLAAFVLACNGIGVNHATPVFMTAAGTILIAGVLRDAYHMAFRDELTGLPSRRALSEQLSWLGRRYTVAMVDVDHFKKFNDTHGHDVGDQVLRLVAAKLRGIGGGGKAFRYGGEEFTILFPRMGRDEAIPHLDELRRTIAGYEMRLRHRDRPRSPKEGRRQRSGQQGQGTVSITVSIGVAESGRDVRKPADAIKAADQALYRAKGRGRNQVSV